MQKFLARFGFKGLGDVREMTFKVKYDDFSSSGSKPLSFGVNLGMLTQISLICQLHNIHA